MSSTYCTRSDIEDLFGVKNVEKWADLDNDLDQTAITDRIDRAIAAASDDVDESMRGGPYDIPIVTTGTSNTPTGIVNIAATLAGVWLYNKRGIEDFDQTDGTAKHKLAFNEDEARSKLAEYRALVRRLDADRAGTMIPKAVDHYTQIADDDNLLSEVRQGDTD